MKKRAHSMIGEGIYCSIGLVCQKLQISSVSILLQTMFDFFGDESNETNKATTTTTNFELNSETLPFNGKRIFIFG